jgi:hypothetical protein
VHVPHPKPFKQRLISSKGRTPFLSGILSLDRVRDGLVWLAESVVAMISQGMEFRCGSAGEMEEIGWQEG